MSTTKAPENARESFIGKGDRPAQQMNMDKPIGELTVRQLSSIFNQSASTAKFGKPTLWKEVMKHEKWEIKHEIWEVLKLEIEAGPDPTVLEDPGWERVINEIGNLREQVGTLTQQVQQIQTGGR